MSNVYESCPVLENEEFRIRLFEEKDANDLFEVYSDKYALPFFNSDNCGGDNFYCETIEHMREAISYWKMEYERKGFVRFSIVDKKIEKVIGTIELFNRQADDYFDNCGLLRLDVRSDYEQYEQLEKILAVIVEPSYELFECMMIATKAPIYAVERIKALQVYGFEKTEERLIGHDLCEYYDYWVIRKDKAIAQKDKRSI